MKEPAGDERRRLTATEVAALRTAFPAHRDFWRLYCLKLDRHRHLCMKPRGHRWRCFWNCWGRGGGIILLMGLAGCASHQWVRPDPTLACWEYRNPHDAATWNRPWTQVGNCSLPGYVGITSEGVRALTR